MISQFIEKLAPNIINKFPPLEYLSRYIKFQLWLCKTRARARTIDINFDINKIILIDPEKINFCSLKKFNKFYRGKIIGGNWDRLNKKIEELEEYINLKEHFLTEKKLEETNFANKFLKKRINNPKMGKEGITINIGRYGDLLLNEGIFELSKAKLKKTSLIPIKITVRHSNWAKFKAELLTLSNVWVETLYHPLTHIDLRDISSFWGEYRFNIIKQNLTVTKGKLLDIGAAMGYFCCKFEDEGFECYAVEPSLENLYFLKKIKRAENKSFKIIPKSIFEYRKNEKLMFDVILALNVFHHFLKKKESYEQLISLLKRFETKEIYLQTHNPEESHMKSAYVNYTPDEFVDFILNYSSLERSKLIGKTKLGRFLYKLY